MPRLARERFGIVVGEVANVMGNFAHVSEK